MQSSGLGAKFEEDLNLKNNASWEARIPFFYFSNKCLKMLSRTTTIDIPQMRFHHVTIYKPGFFLSFKLIYLSKFEFVLNCETSDPPPFPHIYFIAPNQDSVGREAREGFITPAVMLCSSGGLLVRSNFIAN